MAPGSHLGRSVIAALGTLALRLGLACGLALVPSGDDAARARTMLADAKRELAGGTR